MGDGAQAEKSAETSGEIATPTTPTTPVSSSPALKKDSSRPHSRSGLSASPRSWLNNLRRPKTAPGQGSRPPPPFIARSHLNDDIRRDSALQPGTPATTAPSTINDIQESPQVISRQTSLPAIVVHDSTTEDDVVTKVGTESGSFNESVTDQLPRSEGQPLTTSFSGITMSIPTGGFEDLTSPDKLEFSNRGSMLLDGKKIPHLVNGATSPKTASIQSNSLQPENGSRTSLTQRQSRVLSPDEAELSQRVRSMYEFGNERGVDWSDRTELDHMVMEEEDEPEATASPPDITPSTPKRRPKQHNTPPNKRESVIPREPHESAGGLEDWQDVAGDEVDRYGFILPKKADSHGSDKTSSSPQQLMRVSTALVEFSESPRRKRTIRRSASKASQKREAGDSKLRRRPSKTSKTSLHPPGSIYSAHSISSLNSQQSPLRYTTNRLPHNKERRWMDEASDMLRLPPGLEEIAVAKEGGKAAAALRKKELQREEKWRKMGKSSESNSKGGGMQFDFDPRDPKVISRTWKGIPDKWRASAWYSFLAASAKKHSESHSDDELIEVFHALQTESSPDDVQIDCDVPRTINRHIMFRRRYRGGQRLLFRLLHALSLYFPDSGYVQGMAAIAATLLCYYDEEHAFIMMVRLWQLRGLDRLYMAGFEGLMEALEDFEKNWLRGNDVARKLVSHFRFFVSDIVDRGLIMRTGRIGHNLHRLWHSLVPHHVQLLDPFSRATARLGRFHAPWRRF
jgi:hypothetical protein